VYALGAVSDRWATFDCYGTLIDWDSGVLRVLRQLWPTAELERLLRRYHAIEPLVQEGRKMPYRDVGARTLRAIAAVEDLQLETQDAYALADSLPTWPAFPEVPAALARLKDEGWRVAILSNTDPDLLAASVEQIGVPIDVRITAAEAGSYKPALGHWQRFFEDTAVDHQRHVHVGASPFHDLAPCARLGLTAVWINRLGEVSDLPRAAELRDCATLPETLNQLVHS
jgi:2-haloacid dehalogenase